MGWKSGGMHGYAVSSSIGGGVLCIVYVFARLPELLPFRSDSVNFCLFRFPFRSLRWGDPIARTFVAHCFLLVLNLVL